MPTARAAAWRLQRAFRDAASARAVWLGFLGSVCLVAGSLSPAYLPQESPLTRFMASLNFNGPISKWTGTVLTMLGLALLLEFWLRVRPARREAQGLPQLRHWAVLAIVGAPMLLAPPIFSHDAYSYAAQGWLLLNDLNPYLVGPGILPGQFADQVAWVWRDTPAPYGPVALWLSKLLIVLAGLDPYWSAVIMRVPALIGVGMIGWCVPRISGRFGINPAAASWFALTNPVLIIDFIGGAHNDSLMTGLMLVGIWITIRWRTWWWGAAVVGMAATIKQPALLAAVALPFLTQAWTSWKPKPLSIAAVRAFGSLGISVGVFALLSLATGLGFGWINAVNVPGLVDTVSPFTVLGHIIQYPVNALGWDPGGRTVITTLRTVGVGVSAIGIVWLAVRHLGRRPLHFVSWSFLLFAFCAPAVHSWYVLWGGVLFPVTRPSVRWLRAAIVVTGVLLGFAAMNFAIRNGLWLLALLLIWTIWESVAAHELRQDWENQADQESLVRS
ncbi:MAG: polyprenol phosphomannose-dependent alpha 1,6 mannosyltransferase MptB [Propionibacteriaceae bacterium]|nr:polyprenol phosphomannose-dependent alpha 1,6 mannosyltransferase MptB [Propionibacteriaceae bacterium]